MKGYMSSGLNHKQAMEEIQKEISSKPSKRVVTKKGYSQITEEKSSYDNTRKTNRRGKNLELRVEDEYK